MGLAAVAVEHFAARDSQFGVTAAPGNRHSVRMSEDLQAPVASFFASLAGLDFERARAVWDDAGVWHLEGHHDLVGDYLPDDYIELLRRWFEQYPDYAAQDFSIETLGEVVVTHLVTINGRFDGRASGLMIFRVVGPLIVEGWAIPSFQGGAFPF